MDPKRVALEGISRGGRAPASQARALAAALDKLGASVTMKIFPRAGHQVPLAERAPLVNQFLNQHIGARLPAPER